VKKPYVIAECGINANGSLALALDMIKMAADCGCDAVKFQKRDIYTVYTEDFLLSPRESPWGATQLDQKLGLEFDKEDYFRFRNFAAAHNLDISASAWDLKSLTFVEEVLRPPWHKIASAMTDNLEFVDCVARLGRHTYISVGMCELSHVDEVVKIFNKRKCKFTLMHCVSAYPCPEEFCNLACIQTLKERYGCEVGYSDHTASVWVPPMAVSLGATSLEIHITLDRRLYGSDQGASVEKGGLERIVQWSRRVADVIGDGKKKILPQELDVASRLRYWRNG
jgi:N-acetylneuraminate synthase